MDNRVPTEESDKALLEDSPGASAENPSVPTPTSVQPRICKIPVSPWPVLAISTLFFLVDAINSVTAESIYYNKLCYQRFHNLSLCSDSHFTSSHADLQKEEATWAIYVRLLQIPLSMLTNLMLSSYCDRVGHKLPLALPLIGMMISTIYIALLATPQFIGWPMTSVLAYPILNTMFGGYYMVVMAMLSYLGLITSLETRAIYMAVAEGTVLVGSLIGTVANGFIIDNYGLDTLTYMTAGFSVLPLIIALVFFTDVVTPSNQSTTWRDVVGFSHVTNVFRTVYRKRPGYQRLLLNLSFVMYALPVMTVNCSIAGSFLYFIKERGLTMSEYSTFDGYRSAVKSFGGPLLVFLLKRFLNPDIFNFAIGCAISQVIGYTIMSIAAIPKSMWIGATFLLTETSYCGLVRALQTWICSDHEFGSFFAFDGILQCLLNNVISILTKEIYSESLLFWPGMFLAICAFFHVCSMVVTSIIAYFYDKDRDMPVDSS